MSHDAHLFDTTGILLHCDLFHGAFEAKEGLDVQTGYLFKTRPVLVLRVDLCKHTHTKTYRHLFCVHMNGGMGPPLPRQPHSEVLKMMTHEERFSH